VSRCDAAGGAAWKVTHGPWIDIIALRKAAEVAVDGLVTTARVLWTRRNATTGALHEVLLGGGGRLRSGSQQWDCAATSLLAMPLMESR
jgi:hypothetical protein